LKTQATSSQVSRRCPFNASAILPEGGNHMPDG
jgi:hypothetical protein